MSLKLVLITVKFDLRDELGIYGLVVFFKLEFNEGISDNFFVVVGQECIDDEITIIVNNTRFILYTMAHPKRRFQFCGKGIG